MKCILGLTRHTQLDPVTGLEVEEHVVALMTSTALAMAKLGELPMECRTSEASMGMVEEHLMLLSYTLPDEILLPARSLCFHMRNQMEGASNGR